MRRNAHAKAARRAKRAKREKPAAKPTGRPTGRRSGKIAPASAGVWPAVARWAFVALVALPVAWLLGLVALEPASLLQFLAVIAAIGFVFEYLQPRLGSGERG
jgi:hypothetical protein